MAGVWSRSNAALYARMVLLAQLSDTHLLADPGTRLWGHNTTHNLAAVMDALPLRVDVLVVTGDVAEDGSHEAYQFDTLHEGVRFVGAASTFRQLRHGGDPHYTDTLEPPAAQLFELFDDGEVKCRVVGAAEISTDSRLM